MPKVAVDAMGGDHAPQAVIEGALLAVRDFAAEVILVGEREAIERELAKHHGAPRFEIVAASHVVPMHESPSAALRKKDSSIAVAFEMMRRGEVDAVVSAGNSGAMMAIGMFVMGTLAHVARPAILVVVPSLGRGTVIVDAGANVDCKPRHLVQFGLMGAIYADRVLGISQPRVGVLSNGEEESKGNDLTRAASEQLAATALNYIGYVEGRDIFNGKVDVVVCDGFTGNIALKSMEGVASFAGEVLKSAFRKNISSQSRLFAQPQVVVRGIPALGLCRVWRRAADRSRRRRDHRPRRLQPAGDQERHSRGARRGESRNESPYRRNVERRRRRGSEEGRPAAQALGALQIEDRVAWREGPRAGRARRTEGR